MNHHNNKDKARDCVMFQKKIWISAVLLCTLCTWSLFGTIPTAHADAIDDAYSAGKLFGSGSTVLVWGILGTIGAIREMAEDEGINSSNGITLGFGPRPTRSRWHPPRPRTRQ